MDRNLKRIISISAIVLFFCGWNGLVALWSAVKEIFVAFFPIFTEAAKQNLADYLASPYFITGVIMLILSSGFGIWVGKTGGKLIYLIVAILTTFLSFASICANLV